MVAFLSRTSLHFVPLHRRIVAVYRLHKPSSLPPPCSRRFRYAPNNTQLFWACYPVLEEIISTSSNTKNAQLTLGIFVLSLRELRYESLVGFSICCLRNPRCLWLDMFASQTRVLYHIEAERKNGYIEFAERQIYQAE